jgi:hypothetical protein
VAYFQPVLIFVSKFNNYPVAKLECMSEAYFQPVLIFVSKFSNYPVAKLECMSEANFSAESNICE